MEFSVANIFKTLEELIEDKSFPDISIDQSNEFSSISNDSRKVKNNSVFVAIKGAVSDGHNFILDALAKGAKLIVYQYPVEKQSGATFIKVSDAYSAYARLAELFCSFPVRKMKLIAITGTNGKTTTAYLLRSIFEQAEKKCGFISTVEYAYPGHAIYAERTTPDALKLQKLFCEMRNSGCEYVLMETSSHALVQNRTGSAKFAAAVFTNLSGDHLDYHSDMESYFAAKALLFRNHLNNDGYAIINIDDAYGKRLISGLPDSENFITFGRGGDVRIIDIQTSYTGTNIALEIKGNTFSLSSPLYGDFNAYNIAGAVAVAYELGFSMDIIIAGIKQMKSVPGRMEGINLSCGALVIVDYAHTDDALKNVLATLRKLNPKGKLTAVLGCGGDRDKTKRPRMGTVAAKYADQLVLTSDNPRSENPLAIIQDITAGLPENFDFMNIPDRKTAIQRTLASAKKQDIILIAGKGHETYQEIKGIKYPFDDRSIVQSML
jgi:UDP-N-acetylmuramoyl-L-alanyl-D-glutamate--2,6-diaminopimelate ligase